LLLKVQAHSVYNIQTVTGLVFVQTSWIISFIILLA